MGIFLDAKVELENDNGIEMFYVKESVHIWYYWI